MIYIYILDFHDPSISVPHPSGKVYIRSLLDVADVSDVFIHDVRKIRKKAMRKGRGNKKYNQQIYMNHMQFIQQHSTYMYVDTNTTTTTEINTTTETETTTISNTDITTKTDTASDGTERGERSTISLA